MPPIDFAYATPPLIATRRHPPAAAAAATPTPRYATLYAMPMLLFSVALPPPYAAYGMLICARRSATRYAGEQSARRASKICARRRQARSEQICGARARARSASVNMALNDPARAHSACCFDGVLFSMAKAARDLLCRYARYARCFKARNTD